MARILLAEDNESLRDSCVMLLEAFGHTVVAANDGQAAFELLLSQEDPHDFDLVVSDLEMPRLDGLALRGRMRARAKLVDTPFILHTATNIPTLDELCQRLDATLFIKGSGNLADVVAKVLAE